MTTQPEEERGHAGPSVEAGRVTPRAHMFPLGSLTQSQLDGLIFCLRDIELIGGEPESTIAGEGLDPIRGRRRPGWPVHQVTRLLLASKRFGDAMLAHDKLVKAWKYGHRDQTKLAASSESCRTAEELLISAARSYASKVRREPSGRLENVFTPTEERG